MPIREDRLFSDLGFLEWLTRLRKKCAFRMTESVGSRRLLCAWRDVEAPCCSGMVCGPATLALLGSLLESWIMDHDGSWIMMDPWIMDSSWRIMDPIPDSLRICILARSPDGSRAVALNPGCRVLRTRCPGSPRATGIRSPGRGGYLCCYEAPWVSSVPPGWRTSGLEQPPGLLGLLCYVTWNLPPCSCAWKFPEHKLRGSAILFTGWSLK